MVQLPNLPVNHHLSSGLEITIRALRRDEIRLFYDALKTAADSGAGFGYDELFSFAFYVKHYVDGFCSVVYEATNASSVNTSGRRIVAFASIGPSGFSRDRRSLLADWNVVVLPEHRGKKLAGELYPFHLGILATLDFKYLFGETCANNLANIRSSQATGLIGTGAIPAAIYFKDSGWIDLVTGFLPPGHIEPFKDLMSETRAKI